MKLKESRRVVADLLASIDPFDPLERDHLDFAKRWVESGADLFRTGPATPPIHLVSYFVVADLEKSQLLLVDHRKSGLWLPPGGHIEPDENPTETVRREAKEELTIEANFWSEAPLFLTATKTTGASSHLDISLWYLLEEDSSAKIDYDEREFHQIRWFKMGELPLDRCDPHMERFVDKLCRRLTQMSYDMTVDQYAKNTDPLRPHRECERFLELLPKKARVIDIGCGPGRDAQFFAERGVEVHGIDLSAEMVELARKRVPQAHFDQTAIEELAFPQASFDGAWASASLHHLPKKRLLEVLNSVRQLLKVGGLFYLTVKQGRGEGLSQDSRYGGLQKFYAFFQEGEIIDLLKEAHFQVVECRVIEKGSSYETHPSIHLFCRR